MSFDDDRAHFLSLDTETNDTGPSTLRTQHGLTRGEVVQGIASRFMYSRFYITLYVTLVVLSLLSIILPHYLLHRPRIYYQRCHDHRGRGAGLGAGQELLELDLEHHRPDARLILLYHSRRHYHRMLSWRARGGHS
ncbi:hypothetical protein BC937DRAFT_89530 [Endogone sp. FLAS-F59071]|nr:hypothetical protein BC937DRAFT_89530 [Endogone sp. FLAS-F59071]|eukprot:RUS22363.1 hypothetical protein BC937DRAFT_89530 [Endogone sp. FLAS-F59071]